MLQKVMIEQEVAKLVQQQQEQQLLQQQHQQVIYNQHLTFLHQQFMTPCQDDYSQWNWEAQCDWESLAPEFHALAEQSSREWRQWDSSMAPWLEQHPESPNSNYSAAPWSPSPGSPALTAACPLPPILAPWHITTPNRAHSDSDSTGARTPRSVAASSKDPYVHTPKTSEKVREPQVHSVHVKSLPVIEKERPAGFWLRNDDSLFHSHPSSTLLPSTDDSTLYSI